MWRQSWACKPGDIAWVSAGKGTGIPELRREVADLLAL